MSRHGIPGKSAGDGDTAGDVDNSLSAMIQPTKPRPLLHFQPVSFPDRIGSLGTRFSKGGMERPENEARTTKHDIINQHTTVTQKSQKVILWIISVPQVLPVQPNVLVLPSRHLLSGL